jgi:hypothetical protein
VPDENGRDAMAALVAKWAIEPYCPRALREANREHIERTNDRLAGLAVKVEEED